MMRAIRLLLAVAVTSAWLVSTAEMALADAPNSRTAATTNLGLNAWHTETLSSTSDVDWFRFTTTQARFARIRLGHLTADYALELFNSGGSRLALSDLTGPVFEEIYRQLPAGRYFLKVSSSRGAITTTPYLVRFDSLGDGVFALSSHIVSFGGGSELSVDGLNNTGRTLVGVSYDARTYNSSGTQLSHQTGVWAYQVPPRTHAVVSLATPEGAVRASVHLASAGTTSKPRLTFQTSVTSRSSSGVNMSVKNTSSITAYNTSIWETYFDWKGDIIRLYRSFVSTSSQQSAAALQPGQTGYGGIQGGKGYNRLTYRAYGVDHYVKPYTT